VIENDWWRRATRTPDLGIMRPVSLISKEFEQAPMSLNQKKIRCREHVKGASGSLKVFERVPTRTVTQYCPFNAALTRSAEPWDSRPGTNQSLIVLVRLKLPGPVADAPSSP
jgi:hypothetical protein